MQALKSFVEKRAQELMERGHAAVECGDFITALHEFKASSYVQRTSDSLTHWGWMEHHLGDTEKAIDLCQEAIGLDPECGNPYNDIGSYLVALGRTDEAVAWFHKAIVSKNYIPRQFPHINLGKVYLSQKEYQKALFHFEQALRYEPQDPEILEIVQAIRTHLQ